MAASAPPTSALLQRSWHPAGRWLDIGGFGRIHVVSLPRHAQGQPAAGPDHPRHVLLLHGYMQSSWTWRHNLQALQSEFHVHAVCLPGHGWSDKPRHQGYRLALQAERVLALLQQLGAQDCHLIGNSLGGALALQLHLLDPRPRRRLVLVNPASQGRYPMAALAALQHELLEPLLHLPGVRWGMGQGLRHAAYVTLAHDKEFIRQFLAPLDTPGARRAMLNVARYFNRDLAALERRLPDIQAPVLLLWGQADRIVPLSVVLGLERRLPDARLELYTGSGHCPMEEEPERFNMETLAFLSAHLGSAGGTP